ncbi:MAG: hypothetical protein KAR13_10125 [Desulfobulbaceae bacterium]|nr:hypothetical protein [Desulfobulbaceae bacterium]
MKKKVWITSLVKDEKLVGGVIGLARKYGLEADGHFWVDEVEKMAWLASLEEVLDKANCLWVIVGSKEDAADESVRFGLSLMAIGVQARKGKGYPIIWVTPESGVEPELPTLLKNAEVFGVTNATLGPKLVARANTPVKKVDLDYRLGLHANPGFGLWFEVGPAAGSWNGALFGVHDAEINFHGVGEAGNLPEKSTLEYPSKGIKLELGKKEYVAWAVQNSFTDRDSYFVRVKGIAKSILFGPPPQGEEAEVYVVDLV